jgi:hypothetical protein
MGAPSGTWSPTTPHCAHDRRHGPPRPHNGTLRPLRPRGAIVGRLTGGGKPSRQSWGPCAPKGDERESEAEVEGWAPQGSRNVHK